MGTNSTARSDSDLNGGGFLPPDEQHFYDGVVHSLRMRGWSRIDAEGLALELLEDRRAKATPENPS